MKLMKLVENVMQKVSLPLRCVGEVIAYVAVAGSKLNIKEE